MRAGHAAGARVVVDNTFATPLLQKPLELGADIVLHSVTKFLAGHSDIVMGALVVRDPALYDVLKGRRDLIGAIPGTLEAWLALRGLRTLHLRVERAQANAAELVRRLESHPAVASVRYPGFGAVISAELRTAEAADLLDPLHVPVGARHLARQRRVDVRAPPPLEGRGQDHPRGSGPDVRRHRGRRRPLGRPRAGPCPAPLTAGRGGTNPVTKPGGRSAYPFARVSDRTSSLLDQLSDLSQFPLWCRGR